MNAYFLETDDSLLDIEDILCQAARVRGVEVEALCEVIRRNIQNVFLRRKSCIFREKSRTFVAHGIEIQ